jgi:Mg2+-importing ATPase
VGSHTVGFLGDGINDALALKGADVGISVDTASSVAKDAAKIILLEKDLNVLGAGVHRGRITHGNTIKYIKMAASSNFGNVFSILIASCWLPFDPMRPIQILTQNLLYDISQIAIPWDKVDKEYTDVPHQWAAGGIATFMVWMGPTSSIFDVCTFLTMWYFYGCKTVERSAEFQTAWFLEGLLTQTLVIHMIRTQKIPFFQETASKPVLIMTVVIAAIGLYIPWSPVGEAEKMIHLPVSYFGFLFLFTGSYCVLAQLAKVLYIRVMKQWL